MFKYNRAFKPLVSAKPKSLFNYSNLSSWFIHPNLTDLSEKYSSKYATINSFNLDNKSVDLFFVHRTTNYSKIKWNSNYPSTYTKESIMRKAILPIVNIFSDNCNIYTPVYQQCTLFSFFDNSQDCILALDIAYNDIKEAFLSFLTQNQKKNKPIVLVGHSQGACHISRLIKEFCEKDPSIYKRIMMVYLIGWPIENDYFNLLQPSKNPIDTGCFVSWCTFGIGGYPSYFKKSFEKAICINPINWSNEIGEITSYSQHEGGITYDLKAIKSNMIKCSILNNVLQISHPKFNGFPCIPRRDFVKVDFHLFHNNIKTNFKLRLKNFNK